jgi:hypothetical protein
MSGVLGAVAKAGVEGFLDVGNAEKRRATYADFLSVLIAYLIAVIILAFIGKLLWNSIIVDLFSFAKPARSIWQILGLMIFVALVRP